MKRIVCLFLLALLPACAPRAEIKNGRVGTFSHTLKSDTYEIEPGTLKTYDIEQPNKNTEDDNAKH